MGAVAGRVGSHSAWGSTVIVHELEWSEQNGHGYELVCTCGFTVASLVLAKAESKFAAHVGLSQARAALRERRTSGLGEAR